MEQQSETAFHKKWRPAMAWSYMVICLFDFIIAPVLWSVFMAAYKGNVTEAWSPLTLQGAGLFHLAMGGILGVTAWSRGQEKISTTTMMSSSVSRQTVSSSSRVYDGELDGPSDQSISRENK